MRRADYKCESCGTEREWTFDHDLPDSFVGECAECRSGTTQYRRWTSVHTGRGSSGEPPR